MDLLDLVLLYDCNLNCDYCTITQEMRDRGGVSAREAVRHIDEAAALGCTALSLTGGEPTLRRDLLGLIRHAHGRGYSDIKVQTNGLVFSQPANLQRAVDAGLTRVGVSVHAFSPSGEAAYDDCVQMLGAETLMLQGIDNLVAAPVSLTVDLILKTDTMETVLSAMRALHARGVTAFNLWLVSLTDRNAANPDSLPTMTALWPVVKACFDYGRAEGLDVRSLHIPRCMLPGYESHVDHPGAGKAVRVVTPDAVFELSASVLSGGLKPDVCRGCRWEAQCPGIREDYAARHGTAELRPVA